MPFEQEGRGKIVTSEASVSISAERNAGLTRPRNEQVSQPAVLGGRPLVGRFDGSPAAIWRLESARAIAPLLAGSRIVVDGYLNNAQIKGMGISLVFQEQGLRGVTDQHKGSRRKSHIGLRYCPGIHGT